MRSGRLRVQVARVLDVPGEDLDELRIRPRRPYGNRVSDHEEHQSGEPQLQSHADRTRERPVHDRHRARDAGEEDGRGERAIERDFEVIGQPDDSGADIRRRWRRPQS